MSVNAPTFNPSDINFKQLASGNQFWEDLETVRLELDSSLNPWPSGHHSGYLLWEETFPMIINAWNDYVVKNNQDTSNTHLEYYIPNSNCDGGPMNDYCNVARFRSPNYPAMGQIKIMNITSGSASSSGGYNFHPSYPPAPQRPWPTPAPAPAPAPRKSAGAISPVVPAVITVTSFADMAGEVQRQAEFQQKTARSGSSFDRTCKAFVNDPANHQLHFLYEGIEKKKPACDDFFMVTKTNGYVTKV